MFFETQLVSQGFFIRSLIDFSPLQMLCEGGEEMRASHPDGNKSLLKPMAFQVVRLLSFLISEFYIIFVH